MAISDLFFRALDKVQRKVGLISAHEPDRFGGDADAIDAQERQRTDMHRFFYGHEGPVVHKWHHYLAIYDRHLSQFRGRPFRLLEIGVSHGGSLALWRKYFGPEAILFGIDVDPRCRSLDGRDAQVRIGSQTDREFLAQTVREMGGLDVVIDDGSHIASHQRASLKLLWPHLSADAVYICEDLQAAYERGHYEGGFRRKTTFIEFAKRTVDDMHVDFHRHGEELQGAGRSIAGIHFYSGIVVIEKRPQQPPLAIRVGGSRLQDRGAEPPAPSVHGGV
jgi:cephalosporin hydroxylase